MLNTIKNEHIYYKTPKNKQSKSASLFNTDLSSAQTKIGGIPILHGYPKIDMIGGHIQTYQTALCDESQP